ncbi:enoyl-CoA hydratase [Pseudomonas asiatica]|uniref:enoyl-CoA hydratase n=1 Tax=Pseudomonas asiatica TaxID=2219225 RepID=UPI001AAF4F0B|nr:enoyl-CoA hydratase [Pseudomonas asiatica]MBO2923022.1 enoyl-CoA hydratase [Pseudomonas asiatica]
MSTPQASTTKNSVAKNISVPAEAAKAERAEKEPVVAVENASTPRYETILVERRERVGLITLNRPKSLNALNIRMSQEIVGALRTFDADDTIGAIVIAGSPRAFAAGADIEEMADKRFVDLQAHDIFAAWADVQAIAKPVIAAVSGYALGGGCELALMCDFIIASEDAHFGQPEIKLGILPGIGGSQRLTRSVGKALAMDLILTGRSINAYEAKAAGLVARVVAPADLLQTSLEAAHTIAGYNAPAVRMAKEAVNRSQEVGLTEGMRYERRLFQAAFATDGQKEGMQAFLSKRAPVFRHR